MNWLFLTGAVAWTLLLGIWAYRLSAQELYAEKVWVWLWVGLRLFLRFGLGMALLWALVAVTKPSEPAYRLLIVEATLSQAWEKADTLLRQRYAGIRTGLLALKGGQLIWVLPPTTDLALLRWIEEIRPQANAISGETSPPPRHLASLSPYLPFVRQLVWISQTSPPASLPGTLWLWCGEGAASRPPASALLSAAAIPSPKSPPSETEIALLVAGGAVLLLLLGDGVMSHTRRLNLLS